MSVYTTAWERQLLNLAYQGLQNAEARECAPIDRIVLTQAYAYCDEVTYTHSRTFHLASALLSRQKRQAVRALYAFCRVSDDLVDNEKNNPRQKLEEWHLQAVTDCPDPDDPIATAWADTQSRYNIPQVYAEQLIAGVARDLEQARYNSFEELASYCYGVASTVGLMAMHIIGFSGPEAIPYAVKLGVALQLTNILRDIGEDWALGRFYLPQDELVTFGLSEDDIANGRVDERWRAMMRFQIERVRQLYAESLPGVIHLHRSGRFAISAAAELYQAILARIEANGMDNFHHRAYTTVGEKLKRLPGIWWRANISGYRKLRKS